MNHTPGPWTVGDDTQFMNQVEIWPAIGCAYGSGPEVIANAHLIAAAPDLLEALQMVLDYLNTGDMRPLDLRKASAAITKARGES